LAGKRGTHALGLFRQASLMIVHALVKDADESLLGDDALEAIHPP
jgi:hypothetical protein